MIDIHTHILPELDDGSGNVEESISMLGMLSAQGVDTVVATPHFYIDNAQPQEFLKLRGESVKKLKAALNGKKNLPAVAVGAEVQFYQELYTLDELYDFCISGTKYILVEMPFSTWTNYTYHALENLYTERGVVPVIAHLERYMDYQNDGDTVQRLKAAHALIQVNSTFFTDRPTRRRAVSMLKKDEINFIGSDCHNIEFRPPDIEAGVAVIKKKLGNRGLAALEYWEDRIKSNMITI